MFTGRETISYYSPINVAIWMVMAAQAGVINMGGFMACHRFVSHVTGFATFFGVEVVQGDSTHAYGMLVVPLFFLFGSTLSGLLVDVQLRMNRKPRYDVSFGLMLLLLISVFACGVTGVFGQFGEPLQYSRDYLLLIILCLTCGIQNGTISMVSKSVVRTTHLTGITTDLGLGIARYFNRERLKSEAPNEGRANLMRIGLILSFGVGSVAGGWLFKNFEFSGFLFPIITTGGLFFVMLLSRFHPFDEDSV